MTNKRPLKWITIRSEGDLARITSDAFPACNTYSGSADKTDAHIFAVGYCRNREKGRGYEGASVMVRVTEPHLIDAVENALRLILGFPPLHAPVSP